MSDESSSHKGLFDTEAFGFMLGFLQGVEPQALQGAVTNWHKGLK